MADRERDKLFRRLEKKKLPLEAIREIAYGIFPAQGSVYPLRPVTGDPVAATRLIYSFGFNRSKMEQVWRTLWKMSSDEYYTPTPAVPPVGDNEEVLNYPGILPPYAGKCWSTGSLVSGADSCRGTGKPPLYPKTHIILRIPQRVWVCWDCFKRQTDQPDLGYMERFNRGEIDVIVPIRGPYREVRLSKLHSR